MSKLMDFCWELLEVEYTKNPSLIRSETELLRILLNYGIAESDALQCIDFYLYEYRGAIKHI